MSMTDPPQWIISWSTSSKLKHHPTCTCMHMHMHMYMLHVHVHVVGVSDRRYLV